MSASLVGSEMCIRDRRHSEAHRDTLRRTEIRTLRPAEIRTRRHAETHCGCLLYTSDAADDM
eukprot:7310097-Alexandrium_andersonii.AAC.1